MLKTVKLKDNLFVNILPVEVPKTEPVAPSKQLRIRDEDATDQFLIFDRSGSMYYYLNDVVNHVRDYVGTLPEGSTVSVGYFSGTGQYNLSVPYTLKKELNGLVTTLDTYRHALGMTNFVEILNKLNSVVGSKKASLFFFTDGCHNQGGSRADIERALKTWSNSSNVSVFVGHGYIDRDTMSWMASITNGSFVHLNSFADFRPTLEDFGATVADSVPTIDVKFPYNAIPISMSGKNIIEYEVESDTVKFKPSKKGYKGLFWLSQIVPVGSTLVDLNSFPKQEQATISNALRALATVHSQKNNVDIALEVLDYIGDKYLLRNLYNSVTPEEFSQAEALIRNSVFQTKARFVEGEVHGYLPDPNAFCVLDAINVLLRDNGVLVHLSDKDFEYTKIGKGSAQLDGPKLVYPDGGIVASFSKVVMNKERLNVSLSTAASAFVPLDPKAFSKPFSDVERKSLGIPYEYPVSVFRTYAIIADGKVQTKRLVLSNLKRETVNALSTIITKRADGKYIVDFGSIPVINKSYVKTTSAKALALAVWREKSTSDELSVLNLLKKELEEKAESEAKQTTSVTEKVAEFLLNNCFIKNGSYNPPKESLDSTDEYEAYTFSIDFKGYSKISASEVVKTIRQGKKVSARGLLMEEAYKEYNKWGLDSINARIELVTGELQAAREYIQKAKFAIILGNKGKMDEFSSRENMTLPLKVVTFVGTELDVTAVFTIDKITVKL